MADQDCFEGGSNPFFAHVLKFKGRILHGLVLGFVGGVGEQMVSHEYNFLLFQLRVAVHIRISLYGHFVQMGVLIT